jgi:hypothetical protein
MNLSSLLHLGPVALTNESFGKPSADSERQSFLFRTAIAGKFKPRAFKQTTTMTLLHFHMSGETRFFPLPLSRKHLITFVQLTSTLANTSVFPYVWGNMFFSLSLSLSRTLNYICSADNHTCQHLYDCIYIAIISEQFFAEEECSSNMKVCRII